MKLIFALYSVLLALSTGGTARTLACSVSPATPGVVNTGTDSAWCESDECSNAEISDCTGGVTCVDEFACSDSSIVLPDGSTAVCNSRDSCNRAVIENEDAGSSDIFCDGGRSCEDATLATGSNGLVGCRGGTTSHGCGNPDNDASGRITIITAKCLVCYPPKGCGADCSFIDSTSGTERNCWMDDDSQIQAFGDCSDGDYRKLCLLDPTSVNGDCPVVACSDFYEWDEFESECVAVSCEAEGACADNETCVPVDVQCIRSPCSQYVCEDAETDEEDAETDEEETCDLTSFLKRLCK